MIPRDRFEFFSGGFYIYAFFPIIWQPKIVEITLFGSLGAMAALKITFSQIFFFLILPDSQIQGLFKMPKIFEIGQAVQKLWPMT